MSYWTWKATQRKRGTILFSHGAASSPRHYAPILQHWADNGYDVLAPLHVDSIEHPRTADFPALTSWTARIEDMRALSALLGDAAYVAAGHSYGAFTAIALGGGVSLIPEGVRGPLRDAKVTAVIAFSPPAALPPLVGATGYAALAVPSLVQTGTRDVPTGSTQADAWKGHLDAHQAASADGHHYALILPEVDHYFGGLIGRPTAPGPQMPDALDQALGTSSLFLAAAAQRKKSAQRQLDAAIRNDAPTGLRRK